MLCRVDGIATAVDSIRHAGVFTLDLSYVTYSELLQFALLALNSSIPAGVCDMSLYCMFMFKSILSGEKLHVAVAAVHTIRELCKAAPTHVVCLLDSLVLSIYERVAMLLPVCNLQ